MDVRAQMQADLKTAMKDRDSSTVAVLRATLGALANAEAVTAPTGPVSFTAAAGATEAARRELTDDDVRAIVERERDELLVAADERASLGLPDDASALRVQAALLERYLEC